MKGDYLGEFEEIVLLAVRALADRATGATIQERIQRTAARRPTLGAIYAALDRCERKGYVRSWLGEPLPVPGGRRRRHYAVTCAGESALSESRRVREALWRAAREATS
jgi:DNA-binding PadR family transcriptional regulator